ncbi:hypothetical protein KP77_05470 [Jeotgalibacillus alimentarius]|uniref:Uncharacterized protein n=1 Tax=Jeotgalibacillus alimentarius TaxID=135826 RepID=A0A0C2VXL7_9BACL|nr:hypothetical protein KP77_05470 [Jeotgalibacillus alimentarius]
MLRRLVFLDPYFLLVNQYGFVLNWGERLGGQPYSVEFIPSG